MISSSLTVQRYNAVPSRARITILSEPAMGDHAMLGVNLPGLDLSIHMDVDDLDALYIAIGKVLAQLEAHEAALEAA